MSMVNPYQGAHSFDDTPSPYFFGRENEGRRLLSLVISERLVLVHGPGGCGKTSLLRQSLIPNLRENGFAVLPMGQISGPPTSMETTNPYIFQLLRRLHQGECRDRDFAGITLTRFLAGLTSEDGLHYVYDPAPESDEQDLESPPMALIIDGLEAMVLTDSHRDQAAFFQQLDEAMTSEPHLWVVLCTADTGLATVEAHASLTTTHMRARFPVNHLSREAAEKAVMVPAEARQHSWPSEVVAQLCDLCATAEDRVDPFLLQISAAHLWNQAAEQDFSEQALNLPQSAEIMLTHYLEAAFAGLTQDDLHLRQLCERNLVHHNGLWWKLEADLQALEPLTKTDLLVREEHARGTAVRFVSHRLGSVLSEDNRHLEKRRNGKRRKRLQMALSILGLFFLGSVIHQWVKPEPTPVVRGFLSEEDLEPYNDQLFQALLDRGEYLLGKAGETSSEAYYQEALADLLQAHRLRPENKKVLRWIIMTYENLGQHDLAGEYEAKSRKTPSPNQ